MATVGCGYSQCNDNINGEPRHLQLARECGCNTWTPFDICRLHRGGRPSAWHTRTLPCIFAQGVVVRACTAGHASGLREIDRKIERGKNRLVDKRIPSLPEEAILFEYT